MKPVKPGRRRSIYKYVNVVHFVFKNVMLQMKKRWVLSRPSDCLPVLAHTGHPALHAWRGCVGKAHWILRFNPSERRLFTRPSNVEQAKTGGDFLPEILPRFLDQGAALTGIIQKALHASARMKGCTQLT
ncbi:hypothetical protein [Desulfosarcina ovata]|uniref:hypothetical protein n=1 Tax=Desulfosarcina ovata TaxID=83564 RepID=UPI0012D3093E|nr:hypothetical protein [Desulfosarcina ovata]